MLPTKSAARAILNARFENQSPIAKNTSNASGLGSTMRTLFLHLPMRRCHGRFSHARPLKRKSRPRLRERMICRSQSFARVYRQRAWRGAEAPGHLALKWLYGCPMTQKAAFAFDSHLPFRVRLGTA